MATDTLTKKFKMSEYIKDGYLADALNVELDGLKPADRALAEEAIADTATSGVAGTFDQLLGRYRRAIRRVLQPERKLLRDPHIDRKIVPNAQLAAMLDRELKDVTADELAAANAAVKKILDDSRSVQITKGGSWGERGQGTERFVTHEPSALCRQVGEHSTLGACGYFRDAGSWAEALCAAVREAIRS